ncbi:NUDIX hydrolase [Bacillus sp. FJAT-18017]|uniref:NUDIX hydrolase n=1 Tax=Bacillus sp. FJAT-18017 TaxID=1705566 RepID=UPI0006AF437D|nr:NUDIX domain-containing protein [Bacillus sp. FJAT-18017]ALC90658.1 NUDIX hydrolase [Bacillus sp. FJAT-18017]
MEDEQLTIFDETRNPIGIAAREEIHRLGYWHETFHCWFIHNEKGIDYLYLQLRSPLKKDYPNLYDITVAGHLLASETVQDGIREIKEEVGVDLSFEDLIPLGIIEYCAEKEAFIDKELAHTFLYKSEKPFDDFILQEDEVAGMVKVEFAQFAELWNGERDTIKVTGFEMRDGRKSFFEREVGQDQFVPHQIPFYKSVINGIKKNI